VKQPSHEAKPSNRIDELSYIVTLALFARVDFDARVGVQAAIFPLQQFSVR
jgi:hypothetical protein